LHCGSTSENAVVSDWIQIGNCLQSRTSPTLGADAAVAQLTLYLRPLLSALSSSMTLVSSPKATSRVGANLSAGSPPPQALSSMAVANRASARIPVARNSTPLNIMNSPETT
jgi:hypothetical protein